MNKYILIILFFFSWLNVQGQQSVCVNDTLSLSTETYRGDRYWQSSPNGSDWSRMDGISSDTLVIIASVTQHYRYEVLEGSCLPVYSNSVQILVNQPPAVQLQSINSVCLNQDTISLSTGSPIGGTYSGLGILDGRFIPELAGVGTHDYYYQYIDPVTGCGASAQAQIQVNQSPSVQLLSIDSVCLNQDPITLDTGSPAGGLYVGPGIIDGKFIPELAGVGMHSYSFQYTDPVTGCDASAQAQIQVIPLTSDAEAGTDLLEIVLDSVQLAATPPEIGIGYWSVVSGSGGSFADSTQPDTWFYKGPTDLVFTLAWTVTGNCGSHIDELDLIFLRLSSNPCPGSPVVFDAAGTMYPTIQVGDQCWMGENLNLGVFSESTETNRAHSDVSDNGVIEKYCLDNDEANCDLYGGLYDWDEMMAYSSTEGSRGICPEGWHIPSNDDWQELDDFFKYNDPGLHLKEGGSSGFEGLLGGDRHNQGFFASEGSSGFYWTSATYTYNGVNEGYVRELCACNYLLDKLHFNKKTGASVRCIKD